MHIAHFTLHLARPEGELHTALESAVRAQGGQPLRWAVTRIEGDVLTIEGAHLIPCSPSST